MSERLTKNNYTDDIFKLKETQYEYNNALWEYVKEHEDIEEKLGIDLITLYKALTNGVFIKEYQTVFKVADLLRIGNEFYLVVLYAGNYHLKDYGKTWALTKEELL